MKKGKEKAQEKTTAANKTANKTDDKKIVVQEKTTKEEKLEEGKKLEREKRPEQKKEPEKAGDFRSLGISLRLVNKLTEQGISVPTQVQQEALPAILANKNLLVQSPTGTGKTLAYLLPLLERLNNETKELEVLVLVPSRELAFQVVRVIEDLAEKLVVVPLIGGADAERQLQALKAKPKLVVGTPGRVLEFFQKRKLNGQTIKTIVVDEIDKMLSAGFMGDVLTIFKKTLRSRQGLFFSATIPRTVFSEVAELMTIPPDFILVDRKGTVPEQIKHLYFKCDRARKIMTLDKLLRIYQPQRAMIFIGRNEGVSFLAGQLKEKGHQAEGLHSDLSQLKRKNLLSAFREGRIPLLVTTDLLARGMDISEIDYIFNFDLPLDTKHYLHRVGRTGRAGKAGTAITLVSEQQKYFLYKIARDLKITLEEMGLDGQKVFPVQYRKRKD
jgi:ATP-dependent RNA helicase DeaD